MKKGDLFLMVLCLLIITGMYATNSILKKEYHKIDLTDPYKNYVAVDSAPYSVLNISGSNGYPIEIVHKTINDIKVLRSRINHFKSRVTNDTLFIQFSGSNIPMEQRFYSNTPPGIIIESHTLYSIMSTNTHNRVSGFAHQDLKLSLSGNSLLEMSNCNINTLEVDMRNHSQIEFLNTNTVDSLDLKMANQSVAKFQEVEFRAIRHHLSDSITFVLSRDVFIAL